MGRKDAEAITAEVAAVLRDLVSTAKFELIPLSNAFDRAASLPPGATVTVTASPSHGIEATFDLAEDVAALGHDVTPHLSAHMIRGREHLQDLLHRARDTGLRSAFVVGGDAKDRGEFHDGLSLLRAMDDARPSVPADRRARVPGRSPRHRRRRTASRRSWRSSDTPPTWRRRCASTRTPSRAGSRACATQGVSLPVHLGVPGVAEITKLMRVAARIGVADSARYLKKNRKIVGRLLSPGSFGPDALLEGLGSAVADPAVAIQRLHVFTFNEVGATVAWQQRMLAELGEVA